MHVHLHLSKFYDWDPVPKGTLVTEEDIAAGKVMPSRDGGYRMRVLKIPQGGTIHTLQLTEALIIEKIIEEKSDYRRAGRTLSRKQAVALIIQDNVMTATGAFDANCVKKVEVLDDGPHEELFRAKLAPHMQADHARRPGRKNVPPEHIDEHVRLYMEETSPADHINHLYSHFGIRVPA